MIRRAIRHLYSLKPSPLVTTPHISGNYTPNVVGFTMTIPSTADASKEYPRPESRTTVAHCLALPTNKPNNLSVEEFIGRWEIKPPAALNIEWRIAGSNVRFTLPVPEAHFGAFDTPPRFKANSNGCIEVYLTEARVRIIAQLMMTMRSPSDPASFRFTGVTGEGKSHMLLAAVALVRGGYDLVWDSTNKKPDLKPNAEPEMAVCFFPQVSALTPLSPHDLAEAVLQCLLRSPNVLQELAKDDARWASVMDLLRNVADVCPSVTKVVDSSATATTTTTTTATPAASGTTTTPAQRRPRTSRRRQPPSGSLLTAINDLRGEVGGLRAELREEVAKLGDKMDQGFRGLRTVLKTPPQYARALLKLIRELGMAIVIDEENVLYDTLEGVSEDGHSRFRGRLNTVGAALIDAIEDGPKGNTVVLSSACTPVTLHKASSVEVLPIDTTITNTVLESMDYATVHRALETFIHRSGGDIPAMEALYFMLRAAGCIDGVEVNADIMFDRRFFYLTKASPPKLVAMEVTASKAQQALLELARRTPVYYHRPGFQYELLLALYIASNFAKGEAVYQRILEDSKTGKYAVNTSLPKVKGQELKPGIGRSMADPKTTKEDLVKGIMSNAYYCDTFFKDTSATTSTTALVSYSYPPRSNLSGQDFVFAFGLPKKAVDMNDLKFDDFEWHYLIVEASINPKKQFALLDIQTNLITDLRKLTSFNVSHVFASEHISLKKRHLPNLKPQPKTPDQWTVTGLQTWDTNSVGWNVDQHWLQVDVAAPASATVGQPSCYNRSATDHVRIVACPKRLDQIKEYGFL